MASNIDFARSRMQLLIAGFSERDVDQILANQCLVEDPLGFGRTSVDSMSPCVSSCSLNEYPAPIVPSRYRGVEVSSHAATRGPPEPVKARPPKPTARPTTSPAADKRQRRPSPTSFMVDLNDDSFVNRGRLRIINPSDGPRPSTSPSSSSPSTDVDLWPNFSGVWHVDDDQGESSRGRSNTVSTLRSSTTSGSVGPGMAINNIPRLREYRGRVIGSHGIDASEGLETNCTPWTDRDSEPRAGTAGIAGTETRPRTAIGTKPTVQEYRGRVTGS